MKSQSCLRGGVLRWLAVALVGLPADEELLGVAILIGEIRRVDGAVHRSVKRVIVGWRRCGG